MTALALISVICLVIGAVLYVVGFTLAWNNDWASIPLGLGMILLLVAGVCGLIVIVGSLLTVHVTFGG